MFHNIVAHQAAVRCERLFTRGALPLIFFKRQFSSTMHCCHMDPQIVVANCLLWAERTLVVLFPLKIWLEHTAFFTVCLEHTAFFRVCLEHTAFFKFCLELTAFFQVRMIVVWFSNFRCFHFISCWNGCWLSRMRLHMQIIWGKFNKFRSTKWTEIKMVHCFFACKFNCVPC